MKTRIQDCKLVSDQSPLLAIFSPDQSFICLDEPQILILSLVVTTCESSDWVTYKYDSPLHVTVTRNMHKTLIVWADG